MMAGRGGFVPDLVRSIPRFQHLTRREVARLVEVADEIRVDAGEVLAREEEPARLCFILLEGWAEAYRAGARIGRLGPGSVTGWTQPADSVDERLTVRAVTPMRLLMLDPGSIASLMSRRAAEDPSLFTGEMGP